MVGVMVEVEVMLVVVEVMDGRGRGDGGGRSDNGRGDGGGGGDGGGRCDGGGDGDGRSGGDGGDGGVGLVVVVVELEVMMVDVVVVEFEVMMVDVVVVEVEVMIMQVVMVDAAVMVARQDRRLSPLSQLSFVLGIPYPELKGLWQTACQLIRSGSIEEKETT